MCFTVPLLAVLSIAGAVRSADPGAEAPGTLAQEYQKALKESGQISPNFRDAKTDEERKQAVEATDKFARRFVMLAEKHPNDPLTIEVLTQAVRVMNGVDSAIQMSWVTNQTAFPIRSMNDSTELAMTLLLRHHIRSDKLGTACERMRYGTRKEYETFLHQVIKESPHKDVQGIACLSLGQFLNSHSLKFDLFQDRPELADRGTPGHFDVAIFRLGLFQKSFDFLGPTVAPFSPQFLIVALAQERLVPVGQLRPVLE